MKKNLLLTTAIVSFAFIGTAAAAAAESPTVLEGDIQSPITAQSIVNAGTTVNGTDVTASNVSSETFGAVIVARSEAGLPTENNGTLNLTGGTFSGNTAQKGDGGAISNYGNLTVKGTTFTNNKDHTSDAQDSNPIGGGAIALGVDSVTNIEGATFKGNTSGFRGGAIATRRTLQANETGTNGSLTIKDSTFNGNKAEVVQNSFNSGLTGGLGGAIATNFNTEITGGTFSENTATNGGGAIYLTGFVDAQNQTNVSDDKKAGNLTITGTTFDSNKATAEGSQGGAILTGTNSQKLTVNDATFTGNSASSGGGAIWSGSDTQINGGSFTNNSTTGTKTGSDLADGNSDVAEGGGAIFVGGESKVTINGTEFTGNKSGTVGGAIATRVTATIEDGSSSLDISNATFENNSATVAGGAISVGNGGIAPTITNSTFTGNSSGNGGAIYNKGAELAVTGGSFTSNTSTGVGGAITNSGGTLTVTDVAFSGNHSTHGGGAIYSNGSNPLTVKGGSFENNIAGYTPLGEEDAAVAVAAAAETKGGNGGAIFAGEGTTLSVEGTTFSGNQAIGSNDSGFGGAISSAATNATVKDATFENNQASVAGGAINATEKGSMTVTNGTFTGNSSNNGGAVYNKGTLTVDGGSFTNNSSTGVGGAVTNSGGTLTVKEATFEGNRAATTGGAIYTNGSGKEVKIEDSSFTNNEAGYSENGEESGQHNGGAIFAGQGTTLDVKKVTFEGNKASGDGGAVAADNTSTFEDVTFANNTAGGNGGALSITGTSSDKVTFKGNVAFENNTAADGVQNDIHFGADNGSILVDTNATLSLDGGISCANGSCSTAKVEMGQNSTLNVYDDTKVATKVAGANGSGSSATNDFDINVKLNAGTNSFDLANIFTQEGNASDLTDNVVTDNNNLFTITNEDGSTVFAVQEKSASEVASNLGVSGAEAETVLGVMRAKTDNPAFAKVQKALGDLAQSETVDSNVVGRAADALGADAAPVVRTRETMLTNTIFEAANDAMDDNISAMIAQSQTHTLIDKVKFWVKGLFNYADKHDTAKAHGFDIDTYGVAMGIDKEVGAGKVGLGYAYNKSDIDGYTRKTDAKTNSLFLYGKYNPADWYVKGVASYNWSNYKEKKTVLGENADSKYDVNTLALEGLYGYNLHVANGLDVTPEAGLRYIHAKQDASTNALGVRVNARNLDVLTAVAGVKVAKNFTLSNGINIRPEARAALTYDLTTNDDDSIVSIPGGATYVVNGEKLERVGYELGAKVATDITSRFEIAAGYEARIRKDYVDHTGMLSAKYKF